MKRIIDSINLCIVTNRGCNLRCEHCYIEPELLSSTFGMSVEDFKLSYQRLREVFHLSRHTTQLNVEILGGEISRMPYEFWEECLPYSIKTQQALSKEIGKRANMAWCTNMIIQDERYFDLLNGLANEPDWTVFIPWEPDTKRFGTRNKLYTRYLENVKRLQSHKSINVIPTKGLLAIPMDELKAFVFSGDFNDISCDMLYPYGSGKAFFDKHQPTFGQVSDFYIRLTETIVREGLDVSPLMEIEGSLRTGRAYNLNGNDVFDVTIEPDGTVVLNSSMTGTEAPLPTQTLHVSDPLWAMKLMFENARQMHVKFDLEQPECDQCPYLRYCNGGYYHYKYLTQEQLSSYNQDDCPGYRKVWEHFDAKSKDTRQSVALRNHEQAREKLRAERKVPTLSVMRQHSEKALSEDYTGYFDAMTTLVSGQDQVVIDQPRLFGLSVVQRLWFYDSIGLSVQLSDEVAEGLSEKDAYIIARNQVFDNYHCLQLPVDDVWRFMRSYPSHILTQRLLEAAQAVDGLDISVMVANDSNALPSGLVADDRNDELFRFALNNDLPLDLEIVLAQQPRLPLTEQAQAYMETLRRYVQVESLLRAGPRA